MGTRGRGGLQCGAERGGRKRGTLGEGSVACDRREDGGPEDVLGCCPGVGDKGVAGGGAIHDYLMGCSLLRGDHVRDDVSRM